MTTSLIYYDMETLLFSRQLQGNYTIVCNICFVDISDSDHVLFVISTSFISGEVKK